MARTYRVAVIGRTGKGGYGHNIDIVWKEIDNVQIVAVADPDDKGRAAAVKRLGAKASYKDYKTMLDKEKPHIVSVADRFLDQHKDMVIACAQAGASMFMEKPLCRNLEEADEMVKTCEMKHVKVAIAHQTRYSPTVKKIQDLIAEGKLGDLVEMHARGKEDHRGGGEDMMVLGTHLFDLMRLFAGDAQWCHSRIWHNGKLATKADIRQGGEGMGTILGDQIHSSYGFKDGVVGTFGTRKAKHGKGSRFGLTLYGTKGVIQMSTGSLPTVHWLDDPSWWPGKSKKAWQVITSNGVGKAETIKAKGLLTGNVWAVKDLLECIEKDTKPRGSIYDGRGALEMIMAAYESHRVKGRVDIPLKTRKHPLSLM